MGRTEHKTKETQSTLKSNGQCPPKLSLLSRTWVFWKVWCFNRIRLLPFFSLFSLVHSPFLSYLSVALKYHALSRVLAAGSVHVHGHDVGVDDPDAHTQARLADFTAGRGDGAQISKAIKGE